MKNLFSKRRTKQYTEIKAKDLNQVYVDRYSSGFQSQVKSLPIKTGFFNDTTAQLSERVEKIIAERKRYNSLKSVTPADIVKLAELESETLTDYGITLDCLNNLAKLYV